MFGVSAFALFNANVTLKYPQARWFNEAPEETATKGNIYQKQLEDED